MSISFSRSKPAKRKKKQKEKEKKKGKRKNKEIPKKYKNKKSKRKRRDSSDSDETESSSESERSVENILIIFTQILNSYQTKKTLCEKQEEPIGSSWYVCDVGGDMNVILIFVNTTGTIFSVIFCRNIPHDPIIVPILIRLNSVAYLISG